MATIETCLISILMDEYGNWRVAKRIDANDAREDLSGDGGLQIRRADLTVRMSPPTATTLTVDVPDEARVTTAVAIED